MTGFRQDDKRRAGDRCVEVLSDGQGCPHPAYADASINVIGMVEYRR